MSVFTVDLKGQTAIVTAGASGLADAVARLLAECGVNLVLGDINKEGVEKNAADIAEKFGVKAYGLKCDVANRDEMKSLFKKAKTEFGRIDIVVNVAGICVYQTLDVADEDAIKKMADINIFGIEHAYRLAYDYMHETGGRVVGIASTSGRGSSVLVPHYAMTKAAVINLTQSYATLGSKCNLTYNSICPGIIRTDIWNKWLKKKCPGDQKAQDELFHKFEVGGIPLGRAQEPIDIAYAVLFLVSDMGRNVTGQALNIDGGMAMN